MRLFFTLLLVSLSTSLFAQYQVRAVTLTDRDDNVLPGYIKYYDWNNNPRCIEFARDSSAVMKPLLLKTVQKLAVKDGPTYEGLYLKVPYYIKDPVPVGHSIVATIDSAYYLSELLLSSEPVKLYRLFDNNSTVRFILAKYDSLVVLTDIHVQLARKDLIFAFEDHAYRKQLSAMLSECPTLNTSSTLYNEESLIGLIKEYLSFCRIDSKIYLEQKKIGKHILGIGAFSSFWPNANGNAILYGLHLQLLLPKRLNNFFVLMDIGRINQLYPDGTQHGVNLGLYGGRYWGRRHIQGKMYTGLSNMFGPLDSGLGISYRKMVSLDLRYPVVFSLLSNLKAGNDFYIRPLLNLSAILPVNGFTKN